jgi:hypothetical protein
VGASLIPIFCSSLASLKIQADEDGVRTIAILYLICLFVFIALSQIAWKKTLLPDEQFQFFFLSTSTLPRKLQTGAADVFLSRQMSKAELFKTKLEVGYGSSGQPTLFAKYTFQRKPSKCNGHSILVLALILGYKSDLRWSSLFL